MHDETTVLNGAKAIARIMIGNDFSALGPKTRQRCIDASNAILDSQPDENRLRAKLSAYEILLDATKWGAAVGACCEAEPEVVAKIDAHDKRIREQINEPKGMEPPADLAERCTLEYAANAGTDVQRMTAALRLCVNDPRVLGDLTDHEKWGEDGVMANTNDNASVVAKFLRSRRNRLLYLPKVKPWSERYEVKDSGAWWKVYLDGNHVTVNGSVSDSRFVTRKAAELMRLGLIAQREQEKAQ